MFFNLFISEYGKYCEFPFLFFLELFYTHVFIYVKCLPYRKMEGKDDFGVDSKDQISKGIGMCFILFSNSNGEQKIC